MKDSRLTAEDVNQSWFGTEPMHIWHTRIIQAYHAYLFQPCAFCSGRRTPLFLLHRRQIESSKIRKSSSRQTEFDQTQRGDGKGQYSKE
jgi:hypothetical protein